MKNIFLIALLFFTKYAIANKNTYQKLTEVNKCWSEQNDISIDNLKKLNASSEKEWIQLHLSLVEQTLRSRRSTGLSASQLNNRIHCLDILHRYWLEANFPINDEYSYRTPIFIDKYDNFCAVGFLLKETGNESVSRMIANKTNLAYVRAMDYPEVGIWAKENGLTIDELAWIQPAYAPESRCGKIGNGVDGFVQELFVDTSTQQLYVGGQFIQADKSFAAHNIAYVTENTGNYTWHKMANGVNGQVNAIAKFDDKIFVAGSFDTASGIEANNIAYWDGSSWHSAGCIDGVVNDLLVFEDKLYAAGTFKSCGTELGNNFAQWNGSNWMMIGGLNGKINTLEAAVGYLILGGKFNYDTASNVNAIKWSSASSFQKFPNKINNEVMDFEFYQDTLHVACKRTIATDTVNLFLKLRADKWISFYEKKLSFEKFRTADTLSFNSLCSEGTAMNVGGYFFYAPIIGTVGINCMSYGSYWVNVDSTVNKIVLFKGDLIIGGKFKTGFTYNEKGGVTEELNGITKRMPWKLNINNETKLENQLNIYPNPLASGGKLKIGNDFVGKEYCLRSIDGKECSSGKVSSNNEIQLPTVASGIYIIEVQNAQGQKATSRLNVE